MPSNYSGNAANVTTPLVRTVNGCSSGTGGQILVSTTVAHLFATNNRVAIDSVTGTTEANGLWTITVVDSTHFLLNGTTFTNAYVSGGHATNLSLTPFFSFPNDGEYGTAASIEASISNLADATQYLMQHVAAPNSYRLYAIVQNNGTSLGPASWAAQTGFVAAQAQQIGATGFLVPGSNCLVETILTTSVAVNTGGSAQGTPAVTLASTKNGGTTAAAMTYCVEQWGPTVPISSVGYAPLTLVGWDIANYGLWTPYINAWSAAGTCTAIQTLKYQSLHRLYLPVT